jgi:hypothetical protein
MLKNAKKCWIPSWARPMGVSCFEKFEIGLILNSWRRFEKFQILCKTTYVIAVFSLNFQTFADRLILMEFKNFLNTDLPRPSSLGRQYFQAFRCAVHWYFRVYLGNLPAKTWRWCIASESFQTYGNSLITIKSQKCQTIWPLYVLPQ